MTLLTQRPSVSELSQRILDMAKTGVYRESVFEAFAPIATKKQIRLAIAHAKKFGLYSVASLRDDQLGTYYQLDGATYQARQHAIHQVANPETIETMTTDRARQILAITLAAAWGVASVFLVLGILGWVAGQKALGSGLLLGAGCTFAHGFLQRHLTKAFLESSELLNSTVKTLGRSKGSS
ncbi:MAG: hypothetical protein VKK04_14055 [Synechococcales bacterium]|nr:hypothetical protein [Synechococcales bacterium]